MTSPAGFCFESNYNPMTSKWYINVDGTILFLSSEEYIEFVQTVEQARLTYSFLDIDASPHTFNVAARAWASDLINERTQEDR